MKVLIAGATGATGSALFELCLNNDQIEKIIMLHHRHFDYPESTKTELIVRKMDDLSDLGSMDVDRVFCCVGTTIKKAGSKEAFAKVDKYIPIALAKWTKENSAASFHIISADGASSRSLFFYNRVKGSMEESIKALSLASLYIYGPPLLLAERNELRRGEKAAAHVLNFLCSIFPNGMNAVRPLKVEDLAAIMLWDAFHLQAGLHKRKASDLNKKARHMAGLS